MLCARAPARLDGARRLELARRAPAGEHRFESEVAAKRVRHLCPPLAAPFLLRIRRANDERRERAGNCAENVVASRDLFRPRSELPLERLSGNAERGEKFEILILHVLRRVRRNALVGEEPVEIARTCLVEAELHRRAHERRDEPRLDVHLEVDHEIELAAQQAGARRSSSPRHPRAFSNMMISSTSGCPRTSDAGPGLQNPRDVRAGIVALERRDHRQHVHRVADRAHHHDADAPPFAAARHCESLDHLPRGALDRQQIRLLDRQRLRAAATCTADRVTAAADSPRAPPACPGTSSHTRSTSSTSACGPAVIVVGDEDVLEVEIGVTSARDAERREQLARRNRATSASIRSATSVPSAAARSRLLRYLARDDISAAEHRARRIGRVGDDLRRRHAEPAQRERQLELARRARGAEELIIADASRAARRAATVARPRDRRSRAEPRTRFRGR